MSSPRFEGFLARLYCDERFAARFIARPEQVLGESDLDARERRAALGIDPLALQLACRSYAAKRASYRLTLRQRLVRCLRRLLPWR